MAEYNSLHEGVEMITKEKIRVILADDHTVVREGTRDLLERERDIQVVGEAGDGEEAVRLTTALHPDVAIIDIAMPRVNGIEATRQIKTLCPATAVLILTAYDDDPYVFAVLEAGAAGYLMKNARGNEVVDAIRAVKAGESVLHPSIARKVLKRLVQVKGAGYRETEEKITTRELEVLKHAARGMSNKEIAGALVLSARTVQAHMRSIFDKLNVGSRTEAVIRALKDGLITIDDIS